MNAKLQAIARQAADNFVRLVEDEDTEKRILEAWNAAEQEAQDNETKPKFKLGLAITLDLDADSMETALSFGIKFKTSCCDHIPDPNQPGLGLDEGSVTIKTGDKSVTVSTGKFKKALETIKKRQNSADE